MNKSHAGYDMEANNNNNNEVAEDGFVDHVLDSGGYHHQPNRWRIELRRKAFGDCIADAYVCSWFSLYGPSRESYIYTCKFWKAIQAKAHEANVPIVFHNLGKRVAVILAYAGLQQVQARDGNYAGNMSVVGIYEPRIWVYFPNEATRFNVKVGPLYTQEEARNEMRKARMERRKPKSQDEMDIAKIMLAGEDLLNNI